MKAEAQLLSILEGGPQIEYGAFALLITILRCFIYGISNDSLYIQSSLKKRLKLKSNLPRSLATNGKRMKKMKKRSGGKAQSELAVLMVRHHIETTVKVPDDSNAQLQNMLKRLARGDLSQ